MSSSPGKEKDDQTKSEKRVRTNSHRPAVRLNDSSVMSPVLEEVDWEVVENEASVSSAWGDLKWLKGCNSLDKAEYGRHPSKQCVDVMFELQSDVLVVTSKERSGIFGRGSSRNVHHLASIEAIHSSDRNRKLVQIEFNNISAKNFGTRHFFEASEEQSSHYWIMNLKRRLREFAARKKRTVTDLLEAEEQEKETELQESLSSSSSSSSKHFTMREPSVNEAREKFFRDCRQAAENEWIDLGFLWRRTWCSSVSFENISHHFTLSCFNYVRRISLTHTARKSLEKNQRSQYTHSIMAKT